MIQNLTQKLTDLLSPTIEKMGYKLWGCETLPQGHRQLLRVYIEKPTGVTIDDCAKAGKQINAVLSVEKLFTGEYLLEVSSPGMDRIFFTLDQCKEYVGKKVKVKTLQTEENRKRFVGELKEIVNDSLVLDTEEGQFTIKWINIAKVRLIAEF